MLVSDNKEPYGKERSISVRDLCASLTGFICSTHYKYAGTTLPGRAVPSRRSRAVTLFGP
jgi:hypothetical protein